MLKTDLESWLKTPAGEGTITAIRSARKDKRDIVEFLAGRSVKNSTWPLIIGNRDDPSPYWRNHGQKIISTIDTVIALGDTIDRVLAGQEITEDEQKRLDFFQERRR